MTTRTMQDMATAVLRKMGELDAAETASGADYTLVERTYTEKAAEWRDDGVLYWPVTATPHVVFNAVVDLLVNELARHYGRGSSLVEQQQAEQLLLRKLRKHIAKRSSGEPVKAEYL